MKVITRHLTKEILQATGFVLLALVALFAFFDLIGQMGRIGSRYGLLDAFIITGLSLPMRIYEVMPIAALLGAVFVMLRVHDFTCGGFKSGALGGYFDGAWHHINDLYLRFR